MTPERAVPNGRDGSCRRYSVGLYKPGTEIRTYMNRREFLLSAGGATGGAAALSAAGPAAAQENETANGTESGGTETSGGNETGGGNETSGGDGGGGGGGSAGPPDYGTWFSNVDNYGGETVDATGQDEVTITVGAEGNGGAFAFDPPAVHVDAGATILFEWSGDGGAHNAVGNDGTIDSGDPIGEAGVNYEVAIEEDGIYQYVCTPHEGQGMKGAVVVGTDYPTVDTSGGGGTPVDPEHMGVPFQAHFVGLSTVLAILATLVFTFFTLKYGESANTKGGND